MLKSKKNWKFTSANTADDLLIDTLLHARGIHSVEEKQQFLHPNLTNLTPPENLKHIKEAKHRIVEAVEQDQLIMIYGDYDADGITSTALLMNVLIDLGANCDFYIPNRFKDGYGLNKEVIQTFHEQNVSLVITVDTGIANVEEAVLIRELGMDLIITDHHEPQETLPDAFAIIHPKLSENYSFKELAGVGVTFQLAHYLLDEMPEHLLALAAIGTVADLVPLHQDNRILVYYGLKALNSGMHIGIEALKECAKIDQNKIVTERDIGFLIAPRLNAVGRLQDADIAVQLLLTMDGTEAKHIAGQIEELNSERQKIVKDIVKQAEEMVNPNDGIIMLYNEEWHEGVLGIAASRLVNIFDRPVIMLTHKQETNELKGSARSIQAFHMFENGMKIRHLFTQFGGHSQAAGMTFPFENLATIKQHLNEAVRTQLTEEDYKQEIDHIETLSIEEMTEEIVSKINMLAPFGMGNQEPVFYFEGIPSQIRQIGQKGKHLKMQFQNDNHVVDVIGFHFGNLFYFISQDVKVSIVGKLQLNEWNGNINVQLLLEDIAVKSYQLFDYRSKQQEKYFSPYLEQFSSDMLMIGNNEEQLKSIANGSTAQILTYGTSIDHLTKKDILFVCDLPDDLTILEKIISQTKPACIHISYGITDDAFLQSAPGRDDFKWVYGYLYKYEPIQLKVDLTKMMKLKGWKKEKLIFILKVFLDLEFIYVRDDIIYLNKNAGKQSLEESKTYQDRIEKSEIEQLLYYSTYNELKQWFTDKIENGQRIEEEIAHGL